MSATCHQNGLTLMLCVCSAVGTGQPSLFGNNQTKLGTTLGTMGTFGATGFNSGTSTLGFGAPQQPVGETDCDPMCLCVSVFRGRSDTGAV